MQAARGASLNHSDNTGPQPTPSAKATHRRYLWLFAGIAATAYALDFVSKSLAVEHLQGHPRIPLLGDFFSLSLTYNSGAAFSFLTGQTPLLSVVAITATVVVLWLARRLGSIGWAVAFGFLLGGVAGNLTDRLVRPPGFLHGHVVDFFMLPNFPVFNVADICINIAAGLMILQAVRGVGIDGTRQKDAADGERDDAGKAPGS
jgi:signal peptidase II